MKRLRPKLGWLFGLPLLPPVAAACIMTAVVFASGATWRPVAAAALAGTLGGAGIAWLAWRLTRQPLCRLSAALARAAGPGPPPRAGMGGPLEVAMLARRLNRLLAVHARAAGQLRLAASVFDATAEGILVVSPQARILAANEAFGRMSGYRVDELLGRNPRILQSGRHDAQFYAGLWAALRAGGQWRGQIWDRRRDGSLFAALVTISAVRDHTGALSHYVALFSDITDLRRRQDEVERLAYLDPLTGLANRRVLLDRLRHALRAAAADGHCAAVCTVDLDGFKAVNDEHGHPAGDAVLVAAAQRLQRAVRLHDTVVRTGGDEFVIVLTALVDEAEGCEVARRALAALEEPVTVVSGCVTVGASVGLACYPRDGTDPDALLRLSDVAMYRAKGLGRNHIVTAGAGLCHGEADAGRGGHDHADR